MSKSDLEVYQIPLPIYPTYRILNKNVQNSGTKITIMIAITSKEEVVIDDIKKDTLVFKRGDKKFSVEMKDIYCYGEVDFNDKSTLDSIDEFKFLDYLGGVGVPIQSNYDYNSHSCTSTMRKCMWSETWSPSQLARLAHAYLGKPKRILLFNQNLKKYDNII